MIDELHQKLSRLITNDHLTESDVDHFMTLIRKLQERTDDTSDNFVLLNFFCDWTKHATINRNSVGYQLITEINEVLYQVKNLQDNDQVIRRISGILSFTRLKEELNDFLIKYDLPKTVVNIKTNWNRFTILLINIITDCPLTLPVKRNNMVKNSIKEGVIANKFKLSWLPKEVFTKKSVTGEKVLSLIISLSDTTSLILPYKIYGELFVTSTADASE